jgi:hypothetical protein
MVTGKLRAKADTWLKQSTGPSGEIDDGRKALVSVGDEITIIAMSQESSAGHYRITLDTNVPSVNKKASFNTWWIFASPDHWDILEDNRPAPTDDRLENPPAGANRGHRFTLPGQSSAFFSGNSIIPKGSFTWGEALHFQPNGNYRRPANASVVDGIIRIAHNLEEVRAFLGNKPIRINSWYRDPATNARVGGASQSRHLSGDAVDFVVQGIPPHQVNARLEAWWGNRGGLASASNFTHLDSRGHRARWCYN